MPNETNALLPSRGPTRAGSSVSSPVDRAPESSADLTRWLRAWSSGESEPMSQDLDAAYGELHHIAQRVMRRERLSHTLQPTALVNEAFLRLREAHCDWHDRDHFLSVAAGLMRRLLVDHARAARCAKRGGGAAQCELLSGDGAVSAVRVDLLALDAALERLAERSEQQCQMIELSYFGGLSYEEIAEVLGTSRAGVGRGIRFAKAWLRRRLAAGEAS